MVEVSQGADQVEKNATAEAAGSEDQKQDQKQVEFIEEPMDKCLALSTQWGLYEHYEGGDYEMSTKKVAWFGDAIGFAQAWVNLPHCKIENVFYSDKTEKVPFHIVNGEEKRVVALSLFENNILPKWEDQICNQGGEFRIELQNIPGNTIQKIWEFLVFQTISQEFAEADMLCGVRLLDKSRHGQQGAYRIEIWTKFNQVTDNMGGSMKTFIREKLYALSLPEEVQADPTKLAEMCQTVNVKFQTHGDQKETQKPGGGNQGQGQRKYNDADKK